MSKRVAEYGMFVALSFLFAYIETWIPFSLGIPGAKLGLANVVTLTALYVMGTKDAFFLSLIRIVLTGFTFGNLSMMLYSLAGGMLSLVVMIACKKGLGLSKIGVSISGGVAHNLGQLLVAVAVVENRNIFYYLPFLLLWGSVSGAFIGILGGLVIRRISPKAHDTEKKRVFSRRDGLFMGGSLFAGLLGLFFFSMQRDGAAREVVVYVGDQEYARYDLQKALETEIEGIRGGSNHLEIRNGKARVTEATCPDHICMRQGEISEIGQVLVCMPNQVIIAIEGEGEQDE